MNFVTTFKEKDLNYEFYNGKLNFCPKFKIHYKIQLTFLAFKVFFCLKKNNNLLIETHYIF